MDNHRYGFPFVFADEELVAASEPLDLPPVLGRGFLSALLSEEARGAP